MTSIDYRINDNGFEMSMFGHAGSAEKGHDLVCASCSILLYALLQRSLELNILCDYRINPGDAYIKCEGPEAVTSFMTILAGLRILADQYPQFVQIAEICKIKA